MINLMFSMDQLEVEPMNPPSVCQHVEEVYHSDASGLVVWTVIVLSTLPPRSCFFARGLQPNPDTIIFSVGQLGLEHRRSYWDAQVLYQWAMGFFTMGSVDCLSSNQNHIFEFWKMLNIDSHPVDREYNVHLTVS